MGEGVHRDCGVPEVKDILAGESDTKVNLVVLCGERYTGG